MNCQCGNNASHLINGVHKCPECLKQALDSEMVLEVIPLIIAPRIQEKVCKAFNISVSDIKSQSRAKPIPDARKTIAHLLNEKRFPHKMIGSYVNRDQSTVYGMLKEFNNLCQTNKSFKQIIDNL